MKVYSATEMQARKSDPKAVCVWAPGCWIPVSSLHSHEVIDNHTSMFSSIQTVVTADSEIQN